MGFISGMINLFKNRGGIEKVAPIEESWYLSSPEVKSVKVLQATSIDTLTQFILDAMESGWELHGGMSTCVNEKCDGVIYYTQLMVMYDYGEDKK